jgi:hypothetical protein
MSGALQITFMNQRSFGPPPPGAIGSAYEGGFYAGQIGVSGVATHYLVVGPLSSAQSQLEWKNAATATPGADSVINGPQNTADMVADGNSTVYPCAHFCNDLVVGGFSDWYMPAMNELEVCYFNLKPGTGLNSTNSGINANAVPARASNYTTGNPARTSVAIFQAGGAQAFAESVTPQYWCSTEGTSSSFAREQNFYNGYQNPTRGKYGSFRVRATRRVAV